MHPDAQAAHPLDDGTAVLLERDLDATADGLGEDGRRVPRAGRAARRALAARRAGADRPAAAVGARARRASRERSARAPALHALAAARSLAEGTFATERARAFFAGALRALDAPARAEAERRASASRCSCSGTSSAGASRAAARSGSTDALVARLVEHGVRVHASSPVDELPDADVVLADVAPRELLRLAHGRFPERYERALRRYRHGPGAFKLDWALSEPIPWRAPEVGRAATVHLGGTLDELSASEWAAWTGRKGPAPFVLLAQHTRFDPSRAPEGKHTAWAYCHVPNGSREDYTEAVEAQVERFAPGFRETILARSAWGPAEIEGHNRNLVGRRRQLRRDGPRAALHAPRALPRSVPHAARGRVPLLRRDAAGRRRPRDVRRVGRPGRPGRPLEARVTSRP